MLISLCICTYLEVLLWLQNGKPAIFVQFKTSNSADPWTACCTEEWLLLILGQKKAFVASAVSSAYISSPVRFAICLHSLAITNLFQMNQPIKMVSFKWLYNCDNMCSLNTGVLYKVEMLIYIAYCCLCGPFF